MQILNHFPHSSCNINVPARCLKPFTLGYLAFLKNDIDQDEVFFYCSHCFFLYGTVYIIKIILF